MIRMMRIIAAGLVVSAASTAIAGLPSEYQKVEYIKWASGDCQIRTGVTPECTDTIEMVWKPTKVSGNQALWCARGSDPKTTSFTGFMIGAKPRLDHYTQVSASSSLSAYIKYQIIADGSACSAVVTNLDANTEVSAITMGGSGISYTVGSEIGLFASHSPDIMNGIGTCGMHYVYSFKVTKANGDLRCNLVPVYRISDNLPGFYDTVNNKFVANALTGTLTAGPKAIANIYTWKGGESGNISDSANWSPTPSAAFGSDDELVIASAATITVDSDVTVGAFTFVTADDITFSGSSTLTATTMTSTGAGTTTFNCPVQFAGTYKVTQNGIVQFPGGVTATYPDASLRTTSSTENTRTLRGTFNFTADWTVNNVGDYPWIIPSGTIVRGQLFTGVQTSRHRILQIDEGGSAYFTTVTNGWERGDLDIDGYMEVSGDMIVRTDTSSSKENVSRFGRSGNTGTVKAYRIAKCESDVAQSFIPNLIVGAGGLGALSAHWYWRFDVDTTVTVEKDCPFFGVYNSSSPSDWGLHLNSDVTLTINVLEGKTVSYFGALAGSGAICKKGAGTLVMTNTDDTNTGYTKTYAGGTTVNEGTLVVTAEKQLGTGVVTVNEGGTLANAVTIADTSTLTLNAGAILKPAQNVYFDLSSGTLILPDEGTVTVDMTDFTFINGVSTPLLGGVSDGDVSKFTANVPSGVLGSFAITDGILYFKVTSGGSAAAELFWNPNGDSTWSTEVAAWTNSTGTRVSFTDYANATVKDAAMIALPSDVTANDVSIAADGDVTLSGEGKIGGPGSIIKSGTGTFTFNSKGGLGSQAMFISNGVFKVGDDLAGQALGASGDTSPLVVSSGATLDVNYNSGSKTDMSRNTVTHDKLIHIAGDGSNGQGAIVSNNQGSHYTFSDLVLDEDATVGGSVRMDVRKVDSGYARNTSSIYGPGKTLTVMNTGMFGIVNTPSVTLDAIVVTNGGVLRAEADCGWNLTRGVLLRGGTISTYSARTFSSDVVAESGENFLNEEHAKNWSYYTGAITVRDGATLTQTGGKLDYRGTINGTIRMSGGSAVNSGTLNGKFAPSGGTLYLVDAPLENLAIAGEHKSEVVKLCKTGTYTGANIECYAFGVSDSADTTVSATFVNSILNIDNFYLGWGEIASGHATLGAGATLNTAKLSIGDSGTSTSSSIASSFTVDGGTLNHTGTVFYVAYQGPHSTFTMNSGVANVARSTITLHAQDQALGGYNTSQFIQNGGTFNYGGSGFASHNYEQNSEDGDIILKGGVFNATTNWSIPHYIPTCFKEGVVGGWTLNQAEGTTATWKTPLTGNGDVTLNGAATLVGDDEIQGVIGGKWTLGAGFTAGLEGAASILGGLAIGEGATASVSIATNRSAVFTARDGGHKSGNAACITNRFNKVLGGTTYGTVTHEMTFFTNIYASANRPFGNRNYQAEYAVGQFYVDEDAAGTWTFEGYCDDMIVFYIDGAEVLSSAQCTTATGTKELTPGWHSFRHINIDLSGGFGGSPSLKYKYNDNEYAAFTTKNLKMRIACNDGDPGESSTVQWKHFKGDETSVTADTFKNDFAWDFCCITNNLQVLQTYTKNDATYLNGYTVNRYEGWFFVTEENADKTWTFRSQYDDRCAMWIDGVDTGLTGDSDNSLTYAVTLSRGWHRFRIQSADFGGNAGPWDGKGFAVSYQVADGVQTQFSEKTLDITVCPDGYIQGGVTLAKDATLSNGVSENAAVIYGDVTVTGSGAKIVGPFKFEGGKLSIANVSASIDSIPKFEDYASDMFENIGEISIDFDEEPPFGALVICPAAGLTAETAKEKVSVTVKGSRFTNYDLAIEGDNVVFRKQGFFIIVR